jgi:hypothetical protein
MILHKESSNFTIAEFDYTNWKTLDLVRLVCMQVATRESISPHKYLHHYSTLVGSSHSNVNNCNMSSEMCSDRWNHNVTHGVQIGA